MTTTKISVPFAVDLTREAAWNKSSEGPYRYWIVRTHFHLRERQADDVIKMGNKLGGVESPSGVSQEYIRAIKTELTSVQFRESFQEAMRTDESLETFATTLAAGLGASPRQGGSEREVARDFAPSRRASADGRRSGPHPPSRDQGPLIRRQTS